jgi:transposase
MGTSQPRHEFWFQHLRRCKEEGLTLKAYAEREGLTLSVLYGWSKRYKQQSGISGQFTRVARSMAETASRYRLRFPSGLILEWDGSADSSELSRLLEILR